MSISYGICAYHTCHLIVCSYLVCHYYLRWDYCNVPTCQPPTTTTEATITTSVLTTEATTTATEQTTSQATTSSQTTSTTSNSSPSTCSTPELANLLELTSDLRTVYQRSNLPTIDGTSSNGSLPWEEGEETCTTLLSKKKVLLVGIDGLRADVVGMTPLPNIRRLQSMGTYSFWADVQSSASAVSGPGWASMFTGVEPSKHLVSGNGDLGDRAYPTVFKTVKDTFGLKIAASVSWHPLVNELIETDGTALDITFEAGSDCEMAAKAEDWIRSEIYDFVFVDFDGPDSAGHSTGFDGYAETYQKRVISVDKLIGNLLDAVLETSSGEEWLIVLTSDHGGEGTSHSAYDKYNRKIPFIVASNSPRVNVGFMPIDDPGSQMDVLPTIMHFLGGSSAVPEGLDGQVFGFKDYTRTTPPSSTDTSTCGTDSALQADYRGTVNVTANGVPCQAWDSQTPHSHSLTPCNYPDAGLESNYCRNPDGEPNGVWCYTNDPNKRWDYCNVPSC